MAISIVRSAITLGALTGGILLVLAGCEQTPKTASTPGAATATAPAVARSATAEKGGAELWAETCSRCHNLRSPSSYGPRQWDVAVYDMRVRANLTGEEQRKILAFLRAASQ
jgi:cytochrome c5